MDGILRQKEPKKLDKKLLVIGGLVGLLLFAGISAALYYMPTVEQKKEEVLVGAHLPGSEVFEQYTKQIVISTDPNRLQESRTAMGEIIMRMGGTIRNKGDRVITGKGADHSGELQLTTAVGLLAPATGAFDFLTVEEDRRLAQRSAAREGACDLEAGLAVGTLVAASLVEDLHLPARL